MAEGIITDKAAARACERSGIAAARAARSVHSIEPSFVGDARGAGAAGQLLRVRLHAHGPRRPRWHVAIAERCRCALNASERTRPATNEALLLSRRAERIEPFCNARRGRRVKLAKQVSARLRCVEEAHGAEQKESSIVSEFRGAPSLGALPAQKDRSRLKHHARRRGAAHNGARGDVRAKKSKKKSILGFEPRIS